MEQKTSAGYQESEHTADWQLDVWAPKLSELFIEAAKGMYSLSGITLANSSVGQRTISLEDVDRESLLVSFLNELLYMAEQEGLGFKQIEVSIKNHLLKSTLLVFPIIHQVKEIKAVTYHDLRVKLDNGIYRVSIVFDV